MRSNIEIKHLQYFITVAEELHFGRAAQRLGITAPPLRHLMDLLETKLGLPLFKRGKRAIELTEAGARFLGEARGAVERFDTALSSARQQARFGDGQLLVGMSPVVNSLFAEELQGSLNTSPEPLKINIQGLSTIDQVAALRDRNLDAGFIVFPVQSQTWLRTEILFRTSWFAALPEGHRLAGEPAIELRQLNDEPMVWFDREINPDFHDYFLARFADAGFFPNIVQRVRSAPVVFDLLADGMISLITQSMCGFKRGNVVCVPADDEQIRIESGIAFRKDHGCPAVDRLVKAARRLASGPH